MSKHPPINCVADRAARTVVEPLIGGLFFPATRSYAIGCNTRE
jgi:hypothetical protein